jgi:hypothetical protein
MSLAKKLILAFLLMTVVPLGVIIWVSHRTLVEQAHQQIGTRLEDSLMRSCAPSSLPWPHSEELVACIDKIGEW